MLLFIFCSCWLPISVTVLFYCCRVDFWVVFFAFSLPFHPKMIPFCTYFGKRILSFRLKFVILNLIKKKGNDHCRFAALGSNRGVLRVLVGLVSTQFDLVLMDRLHNTQP